MKPLDPLAIDLEKSSLIEASAGTGKTYTITTLFLRLLARGYPIESILVVTFTEAAAAELKLRIRTRLLNTLRCLKSEPEKDDDDLTAFLRSQKNISKTCRRFSLALTCFDQSAVMTIHAFCFKILKDYSFESRSYFDMELVPDQSAFLMQAGYDFFMGHINDLDPLFLTYLSASNVTPESFIQSFKKTLSRPDMICLPEADPWIDFFNDYRLTLRKVKKILDLESDAINQLIRNHQGIDKRSYSKRNVPTWLSAVKKKIKKTGHNTLLKMEEAGDPVYKFTVTRLKTKTKPGKEPPYHPFFDECEQLLTLSTGFKSNLIHLKHQFIAFLRQALELVKQTQGICFFDDLVNDLAELLDTDDGQNLVSSVRQTYKACLIDEFQDTDPRQYDIFSCLFAASGTPFFMIGDPKQAIYAFRGGDIFAYLKAARHCEQRFTLNKNYRSGPALVNGVNQVFGQATDPFIYKDIEFTRVSTPETATDRLLLNDKALPPLQFKLIQRDGLALDRSGFIPKSAAVKMVPQVVAADIAELLQSQICLQNKENMFQPVVPGDIAILVRTNAQAEHIQQALTQQKVPSYLSKTGSVFDSTQAVELNDILHAVLEPGNVSLIRAALCTSVFGFDAQMIVQLDQDEEVFYFWQAFFGECMQVWKTSGFVPMIMSLFHSSEAFLSAGAALDERALTNFYHLVELIAQASLRFKFSAFHLMKWFSTQLSSDLRDQFVDELRLESDRQAVAIVTIHKSKGLEYPIVYLPYLWEGQHRVSGRDLIYHDPDKGDRLTLDLGSSYIDKAVTLAESEDFAEQRRLLYVALTRGSAMCKIIWGGFASVETSSLAGLVHPLGCKKDTIMVEDLERLTREHSSSILTEISLSDASILAAEPSDIKPELLAPRACTRSINPEWKMSSFSAMAHSSSTTQFQHQEIQSATQTLAIDLEHFPKGAIAGDFFHAVFENIDFTGSRRDIKTVVELQADQFGFTDMDLKNQATESICKILKTPLETNGQSFSLQKIAKNQRLNEMPFTLPVNHLTISGIQQAMNTTGSLSADAGYLQALKQLEIGSVHGFLKGFIDLVACYQGRYYIIDYKSNYLGSTYQAYDSISLCHAMAVNHYFLQYHIYLLALHQYLSLKVPQYDYDKHIGGVFYLFIRGMHPDFKSRYGVFADRPPEKVIRQLSDHTGG